MKKHLYFCVLLLFTIIINLSSAKEYGNKCLHSEYPDYIQVGETVSIPGKCLKIKCLEDKTIEVNACPYVSRKGCKHTKIDFNQPYPDCCPKLIC